MTKQRYTQGFTLVELAIVLTIIGLLLAGLLKGKEMMLNAEITATVTQIKHYEAAISTFADTYNALPGDLWQAPAKLPGCTIGCTPGSQDNFIGDPARPVYTASTENGDCGWLTAGNTLVPNPQHRQGQEVWLFWQHMYQAGLIGGISNVGMQSPTLFARDVTHPSFPLGGVFWVRTNRGGVLPPGSTSSNTTGGPTGSVMLMMMSDVKALLPNNGGILSTKVASILDRKMDDGVASRGNVQGGLATCYETGTDTDYNVPDGRENLCTLHVAVIP